MLPRSQFYRSFPSPSDVSWYWWIIFISRKRLVFVFDATFSSHHTKPTPLILTTMSLSARIRELVKKDDFSWKIWVVSGTFLYVFFCTGYRSSRPNTASFYSRYGDDNFQRYFNSRCCPLGDSFRRHCIWCTGLRLLCCPGMEDNLAVTELTPPAWRLKKTKKEPFQSNMHDFLVFKFSYRK